MKGIFPIDKFRTLQTPFYYYDTKVLRDTLSAINQEVAKLFRTLCSKSKRQSESAYHYP